MAPRTTSNPRGAHTQHGIDLSAPGGVEALLAFHRSHFGDLRMEADGDDGDDEDGTDGGTGTGDEQDDFGNLLDDEAGAQDDGDDDEDDSTGGSPLTAEAVAAIVESTVDRRINAVLREVRGQNRGSGRNQTGQQRNERGAQAPSIDPADAREARGLYREFIADEVRFLGKAEREHALALADGAIRAGLLRGQSADEAGRNAADEVATSIKGLRQMYSRQTVNALRRKGLLVDNDGEVVTTGTGQQRPVSSTSGGRGKKGTASQFQAGAERAKRLQAGRLAATGSEQ